MRINSAVIQKFKLLFSNAALLKSTIETKKLLSQQCSENIETDGDYLFQWCQTNCSIFDNVSHYSKTTTGHRYPRIHWLLNYKHLFRVGFGGRKKNEHSLWKEHHEQIQRQASQLPKPRVLAGILFGLSTEFTEGACRTWVCNGREEPGFGKPWNGGLILKTWGVIKKG